MIEYNDFEVSIIDRINQFGDDYNKGLISKSEFSDLVDSLYLIDEMESLREDSKAYNRIVVIIENLKTMFSIATAAGLAGL